MFQWIKRKVFYAKALASLYFEEALVKNQIKALNERLLQIAEYRKSVIENFIGGKKDAKKTDR